ncbi:MAG: protein kinase domain-containing protein [Desulfonatronovibrio sp.]
MRCIGKYRLLSLLGRGGMGSVYKVLDLDRNRLRALKIMRPSEIMLDVLGYEEIKARFLKEAHIMEKLGNRHVAGVFEVGEHKELPFMVQEYLCLNLGLVIGEQTLVEKPTRPLSPLQALEIVFQVLDALSGFHQSGLVYRDVKPENIMLTRSGLVKIIDFGLSRFMNDNEQTPAGMIVGSPYYAAPEQIDNPEKADPRADIYSAGVVLQRMVTGYLPGTGEEDFAGYSLLGPGWENLLKQAMAPDPANRFPDAASMNSKLRELKTDWIKRQEQVCALSGQRHEGVFVRGSEVRSRPVHTGKSSLVPFQNMNSLMQPVKYFENKFEITGQEVLDHATGLTWAGSISGRKLNFDQTFKYIQTLNQQDAAPGNAFPWRVPTVDELMTLLEPRQSLEDFCGPDLWNLQQISWLWSADSQSRTRAWILDMNQGAALHQDRVCRFHVLPVRQSG